MMRLLKTMASIAGFLLFSQLTSATSLYNNSSTDIKNRIAQKAGVFDLRYSDAVHFEIENYLIRGKKTTQRILSRTQLYFPIIEKYLAAYGLPDELKYLTVIESALDPNAASAAGAVGLWQLMPATARRYGLVINHEIDERKDPHKSTEAALKYLSFLYELTGDWTLAVAAYNCGGGGVQKAMRLGKDDNFWAIKTHFPIQTQNYIDRLTCIIYVLNFYPQHGLQATETDYFLKFTKVATVYSELSFKQISEALDIPLPILKKLNPSYRKEIVPDSTSGNYLILPKLKMDSFISYYNTIVAEELVEK